MASPQTPPDDGYERVAVCWTDDPEWTLDAYDSELDIRSTHLVRADELLVATEAGMRPADDDWEMTDGGIDGFALYRRRGTPDPDEDPSLPLSGVPVMSAVADGGPFAPNAVFCSQGLRYPAATEAIGPFKVAPAYQGEGDGPKPPSTVATVAAPERPAPGRRIAVAVIDTGLGQGRFVSHRLEPFVVARCLVEADTEDHPDFDLDRRLDSVAGHGTLVAGLIAQAEPQVTIQMVRAVDKQGAVSDLGLAHAIDAVCELNGGAPEILNLSLGGWSHRKEQAPPAVADRLRRLHGEGTAIVAAAGNLRSEREFWPAAMREEVIGVAAVTRGEGEWWEPTEYSNYGEWVTAAVEAGPVVGPFYENFISQPESPKSPPDVYEGLVEWEGTSFLAAQVAGHLCRLMIRDELSAQAAWERLKASLGDTRPLKMPSAVVLTREILSS